MNKDNKHNLTKRIEDVLKNKNSATDNAYTKSLEELVEELNIYQLELEFQNDELQRIQLELEQSKEGYFQLFENAPVGYVIIGEDMKLIDCNQTFKKMLSDSKNKRECRKQMDFREFITAADQDKFHFFFAQILKSKDSAETELALISPDNEALYVQITGRYSPSDTDYRALLSVKDITERKQAEERIRKSETKLRELNITKDKLFSIIAHDLKSPFNTILGFSDLLVEQVGDNNYEGIDKYAEIVAKSSHRLMDLLTNLLEWSQAQTGSIDFNPKHLDLRLLINECMELFDDNARQKSITIHNNILQETTVFADHSMISSVMRNLISNAVKFTNMGGQIVISAQQTHDETHISVNDNGIGIEPERISSLFRIDSNTATKGTNKEKGTGLGLILSKEFVERHGGLISVMSETGKGSTFHFTLPSPE